MAQTIAMQATLPRVTVVRLDEDKQVQVKVSHPDRVTRYCYQVAPGRVSRWLIVGWIEDTALACERMTVVAGLPSEDDAEAAMMRYARQKAAALRKLFRRGHA